MKTQSTRARSLGRPRAGAGFNFLELLVVMAIIMILAVLVIPEFRNLLIRFKLEGAVQGVAHVMGQARAEAIRRGVPVVVSADVVRNELLAYADVNATIPLKDSDPPDYVHALKFDPNDEIIDMVPAPGVVELPQGATDYEVARYPLPGGNLNETSVKFWGAEDDDPGLANVTADLTTTPDGEVAIFLPNGSIRDVGGFRIAMGPKRTSTNAANDEFRNFFEIYIEPLATAKITVRKWIPDPRLNEIGLGTTSAAYLEKFRVNGQWTWKWY